MPLGDSLSLAQARRIALAAQGFTERRPAGRIDRRHFRRVLERVSLVQVDSVNVITRSHELPFLARLGPYPRAQLGAWLWGSGEVFEYWGHEASLLPAALHPLLRWRMHRGEAWGGMTRIAQEQPQLVADVLAAVHEHGPVALGQIEGIEEAHARRMDHMWGWSEAKRAVEWLFWTGQVTAIRDPASFTRHYLAPDELLPAEIAAAPDVSEDDAHRALLLLASRSCGVGTAKDLADYFRLNVPVSRTILDDMAADGELQRVEVEGWKHPGYLHPEASLPRRVRATALLSPFDSLIWERDRVERLFGFRYRIEIYVPASKRVHGYYVLPFLQDEALTARVDLKADRKARALLVRAAFGEDGHDPSDVAIALLHRLEELAGFLGLDDVVIEPKGDLAPALAAAARS